MDWSWSEDQQSLRELSRKILEELVTHERLKTVEKTDDRIDREVWKELAKANLLGIPFAEADGGSGMTFLELVVLLEEIGRAVAPVPVYETLVLGGLPIARFGTAEQKKRFLPRIANGEVILSGALTEPLAETPEEPNGTATKDGTAYVLDGTKGIAPLAQLAERVLVTAKAGSGVGLFLLDPRAAGVKLVRQEVSNYLPHYVIELSGARVAAEDVLVAPEPGRAAARWVRQHATAALAAMSLGVADKALQITAKYTTERKQFDRPIGSFQAVHQRAGDSYIDILAIRLPLLRAVHLLTQGGDAEETVAIAKFWAAEGGNRVTYAAQHLHGGIGLDLDYPLHRYYLWARQLSMTLGGATRQLVRIGEGLAAQ